jgi:serine/threonine-protein kinase
MPVSEYRIALPARYRLVGHIANGGMASVWAAEDELLGRLVAVKVLATGYAQDERANRRFLREARAGARLSDCRHVVTVYDIGEHDGRPFMVMEHFSGGTVADRLRRGRDIPRALALRWLREAAEALDCANRHDVVHRDVKPANLLIDERGRLAVGDFGIATVAAEASLTQTGQVLGTAAYISPEQARGQAATDASDRYALAVVAFELLTGRRPFTADHPAAQARAHVEDRVPSASVAGGLPAEVDHVLSAGMAKDPAQRPATAAEFLDDLEDAIDGAPVPAAAPTAVTAPIASPPRPPTRPVHVASRGPRRRWPGIAALAVLALVAGVAIAIAAGTGNDNPASSGTAKHTTSAAKSQSTATTKAKAAQTPAATQTQQTTTQTQTQTQQTTTQAPATGAQGKSDDPVALNDQGFALIGQGKPGDAVAPLQRSVAAFRAQNRKGDIGYAYALYNLGNALRLSGHPAEAIPYLEERLQVSNYKRGVVQKELKTARQQAG